MDKTQIRAFEKNAGTECFTKKEIILEIQSIMPKLDLIYQFEALMAYQFLIKDGVLTAGEDFQRILEIYSNNEDANQAREVLRRKDLLQVEVKEKRIKNFFNSSSYEDKMDAKMINKRVRRNKKAQNQYCIQEKEHKRIDNTVLVLNIYNIFQKNNNFNF